MMRSLICRDPFITAAELKALSEEALMTDAVWQEVSGGRTFPLATAIGSIFASPAFRV